MANTRQNSVFVVICLGVWKTATAFDLKKETELFIGIGAGIGGLVLGVVFVIIALLCRKHLSGRNDIIHVHRKRKPVPSYHELVESRASSFRTRKSAYPYYGRPLSFENNAFTIEETSFARPAGTFSTFVSNSMESNHPSDKDNKETSLKLGKECLSMQQSHSSFHRNQNAINPDSSTHRDYQTNHKSKTDKKLVYKRTLQESLQLDRADKSRHRVKVKDREGFLQELQTWESNPSAAYNAAGNRNSLVSLIPADDTSRFSLPRLSVHRSENYVDITGEGHYTNSSLPY